MPSTADLLEQLTLEEKAALCQGADAWHTAAVARLGVESVRVSDGPHGLRREPDPDDGATAGSLPATCFPTAAALSSSWDRTLLRQVGIALGAEARSQGVAVLLGPGVNIKRSPLCGRNFEYLSEDPHLSGRLGAELVDGLQSQGVGTSVKHFAANNQETDRHRVSADVDERTLREIYLPAFEYIVAASRPWTVMCAYNRLNGEHASQHPWLLTEVLRDEWGFEGLVMSDWGAVHDRVAALAAGLDLEMPPNPGVSDRALVDAVKSGELDEALLDQASARVLSLVDQSSGDGKAFATADYDGHHALARRTAAQGIVLLKNNGVLPLAMPRHRRVAVVGEFARTPRIQGAGSSAVHPTRVDVALDELRVAMPAATVTFAPGFRLDPAPSRPGLRDADDGLTTEAVAAVADADVVLAFLGLPADAESEGFDRTHIDLPAAQTDLLARLAAATDAPVVVLLTNGSVVRTTGWDHLADAVVECWLPGQGGGGAIADVLTGAVNPSGRLAETVPRRLADTPSYLSFPGEDGHVRYGEGVFVGYRGFDAAEVTVAYPFGHGLSYTTFDYGDLAVSVSGSQAGDDLRLDVSCVVANAGQRAGAEIVQLYVGDPVSSVVRPPQELRGFVKVVLEPGERQRVDFSLSARDLSYWSVRHGGWVLEGGEFHVAVGASSRDIRIQQRVVVDAAPPAAALTGWSTLAEWLGDPAGADRLREAVGTDAEGRPRGILGDDAMAAILVTFPLHTLAVFPETGITRQVLARLGTDD